MGDRKNVFLNNYGLGDIEGEFGYNNGNQAFNNGEASKQNDDQVLPIKTLDWYVKENNIKQIDFLKIDTEGYDFKVLLGGKEAIKLCRYIQFEHWSDKWEFYTLLNADFWMRDIGGRNILCLK